jgi:hypothetical protein
MIYSGKNRRKGIAIVVVLAFCVGILGLVTVLVMNTRFHKGSHQVQFEQIRALMAAKAAMQLAIYKFRVLPSEFYKIHDIEKALEMNPLDPDLLARKQAYKEIWNRDFNSEIADSPAAKIKQKMNSVDMISAEKRHSFSVEEFRLVSRKSKGYIKDYVKIRAVGSYGNARKVLEELIEVKVVH